AFGKSDFYDLDTSMSPRLKKLEEELSTVADQSFNQILNPFSQEMEFEADSEAIRTLVDAGYNPYAAINLLDRLRMKMGDIPAYAKALHSHPPTIERIQSLKNLAKDRSLQNSGALHKERFLYYKGMLGNIGK
ncbi:MAG: M48 family metalloprotease, partial [Planctomycetota bacterium]